MGGSWIRVSSARSFTPKHGLSEIVISKRERERERERERNESFQRLMNEVVGVDATMQRSNLMCIFRERTFTIGSNVNSNCKEELLFREIFFGVIFAKLSEPQFRKLSKEDKRKKCGDGLGYKTENDSDLTSQAVFILSILAESDNQFSLAEQIG